MWAVPTQYGLSSNKRTDINFLAIFLEVPFYESPFCSLKAVAIKLLRNTQRVGKFSS